MRKLYAVLAAIALAAVTGCDILNFDSSDNRSAGGDGWSRDEHGMIIPAPTPDPIEEALND